MVLLSMSHPICCNIMAVKVASHNLTYHALGCFWQFYCKRLATFARSQPASYGIYSLCKRRKHCLRTHCLSASVRLIQHSLTLCLVRNHIHTILTQSVYHSITQRYLCLRRLHTTYTSLITLVSLALVETLRWRNHIALIVTSNKVVQLAVVLHVLVAVAFAIVIPPLSNVISVKPQLTGWHFVLHDTILAIQTMLSVHLSILTAWSHPVAIS